MAKNKRAYKAARELGRDHSGGNELRFTRIRKSPGKATTVEFIPKSGNAFFNPDVAIHKALKDQLFKDSMIGPVRVIEERLGEVVNLKDPEEQRRSCAGILAKKYFLCHQVLRNIYNAMQRRLITDKECAVVFRIVGELGVDAKTSASAGHNLGKTANKNAAAERASSKSRLPLAADRGCPEHEDNDSEREYECESDGDSDCLAGPEEEDSCL